MKHFLFKKIGPLITPLLLINLGVERANAASVWNLELRDFKNKSQTISFDVYKGLSVNIILIPSGMEAKVAWIDDISYIGLSFDGVLCEKWLDDSCRPNDGSASVVHVNLHKNVYQICNYPPDHPLALNSMEQQVCDPGTHSDDLRTSLTLLVEGQGKKQLLVFDVIPKLEGLPPRDRVTKIYINPDSKPVLDRTSRLSEE